MTTNKKASTHNIAIVRNGHGDERVHAANCADVKREVAKFRNGDAYLMTADTFESVARDWYSDVASDNYEAGTAEWEQEIRNCADMAMTFLPCCKLTHETTDTPEETPVTTDTTVHTADTVTLPDGITETPALRPVYAAILNAGSGTAKDFESTTGIILAKVRVALNILKSLNLVTSTDQAKPGQSVVWSIAGTDATDLFADTLSLDLGTVRTGDDMVTMDTGWNTMNDDNEDPKSDDEDDDTATDDDEGDAPAQNATGDDTDEDEDDTPAPVVDTPPATRRAPKRVRLLAIYPGETARAERTGPFKTVRPNENPLTRGGLIAEVTEWFASHPGEDVTVSRIGKELGRYPTAVARSIDRMAAKDARYAKVEDAATRTYRFNA